MNMKKKISTNERVVYLNGEMVGESEARISIYDSALMFGDMVFEMTRSFNKKQFKLKEHINRLYAGLKILRIPMTMTPKEMEKAVHQTIEANMPLFDEDDEHRVLIDVTRGTLGLYENVIDSHIGPNVVIADFPLRWTVVGMGKLYDTGINAVTPNQRTIPASLLEAKIKNRSRIHYMMANIEVSGYEGDNNWALLLDTDGFLAEGTGANLFLIKDGKLLTPEPRNILCGVTRAYIIEELAPFLGIEVIEKNLETYDIYNADEAFFTSTPFCMLPIVSINSVPIGNGQVGEMFHHLLSEWSKSSGVDIISQIKDWNKSHNEKINAPTTYRFNNE